MNKEHNDVVMLELDRPRELRLGHKAMKRFSSLTGCSMTEMEKAIQHYETMTKLIWVMVTQEQAACGENMMTPEQLDDLLDAKSIYELTNACSKAIEAAFVDPSASAQEETSDPLNAAGTGSKACALPHPSV